MKQLKTEKILEYGETAVQALFLLYTILGFNSITFGSPVISVLMWVSYLMGAGLLLVRLWNWKRYIRTPGLWCLVAMCVVCVISIGLNLQYDLKRDVIYLIFWIFYFFLYFAQREDTSPELAKKRFRLAGQIVCISAFVLAVVSLVMMALRYSEVLEIQGTTIVRGFAQGRLFGAYLNPNGGAFVASAVIILSIHFIRVYRKAGYTVFGTVNILAQFMYLVFSDSRGGRLCLMFGLAAYVLFAAVYCQRIQSRKWKTGIVAVLVILTAAAAWYAPKLTQTAYNQAIVAISANVALPEDNGYTDQVPEGTLPDTQSQEQLRQEVLDAYQVDRGYDLSGDISNRRFDIWKSGLEVFMKEPLFGHTFSGFLPYAIEKMPETYIVANDSRQMDTLENDFLNLLVSNGIVGFLLFLVFVVRILVYLFRRVFVKACRDFDIPVMMALCAAVAVFSMFNSSMLYSHSQVIPLFWLSLGSMTTILSGREKEARNG